MCALAGSKCLDCSDHATYVLKFFQSSFFFYNFCTLRNSNTARYTAHSLCICECMGRRVGSKNEIDVGKQSGKDREIRIHIERRKTANFSRTSNNGGGSCQNRTFFLWCNGMRVLVYAIWICAQAVLYTDIFNLVLLNWRSTENWLFVASRCYFGFVWLAVLVRLIDISRRFFSMLTNGEYGIIGENFQKLSNLRVIKASIFPLDNLKIKTWQDRIFFIHFFDLVWY